MKRMYTKCKFCGAQNIHMKEEVNMIQVPEPDYYIHIGIRGKGVVQIDWKEMVTKAGAKEGDAVIKETRRLLKIARKMLKPDVKTKSQADIIEELLIKAKKK